MLHVPQSKSTVPAIATTQPASESRLSQIIRAYEEAVLESDHLDCHLTANSPVFHLIHDQTDALAEEASYHIPTNDAEAVFLLVLAGSKTDLVSDGGTRKIKKASAKCQTALIAAALRYFEAKHKGNYPATWNYSVYPTVRDISGEKE